MGVVLVNTRMPFWWLVKMSACRRSCNRATSTNQPFLASLRPSPSASQDFLLRWFPRMRSNTNNRLPSRSNANKSSSPSKSASIGDHCGAVKPPTQGLVNGPSFQRQRPLRPLKACWNHLGMCHPRCAGQNQGETRALQCHHRVDVQ